MFDPTQLPLPDLGLRCRRCGYPLALVTQWKCPECGESFDLEDYIPPGAMPMLIAGGEQVRGEPEIRQLLDRYAIPVVELTDPVQGVFGGIMLPRFGRALPSPHIGVPRDRYFEAVDLIRRHRLGEPMPPVPAARVAGPEWPCPECGEENPGSFEICWQCGGLRP
jgi:hypothetical protein